MVELADCEREILLIGRDLMARLIAADDWLPARFSAADPAGEQQFQLYADAMERFSIVCTVLAPGQTSPIADQPFWQILGVLRGALVRRRFEPDLQGVVLPEAKEQRLLEAGALEASPAGGAAQLHNALGDAPSIALQVFGGEIGKVARASRTLSGAASFGPTGYANAPDAPPFDIWTIQTRIED
jgi:predicted metal-dependent enzyme (double-stranded beta helix superfamily)